MEKGLTNILYFLMRKFPLDALSLCDLIKISDNKFSYNDKDYLIFKDVNQKIYRNFINLLNENIETLSIKSRHIIYSDYTIINSFLHHMYYRVNKTNFLKSDTKIIFEENSPVKTYYNFNNDSFKFKLNNNNFNLKLRNLLKDFYTNKNKIFKFKKKYLAVGSLTHLKIEYANKISAFLTNKNENYFYKFLQDKEQINIELKMFYEDIFKKFKIFLNNEFLFDLNYENILKIFLNRAEFLNNLYLNIEKKILDNYDGILLDNVMNPIFRIACSVFKINNKDAITLDHGTQNHEIDQPFEMIVPLVANKHVCFNTLSRERYQKYLEKNKESFFYIDRKNLILENCNGGLYKKIYLNNNPKRIFKKKKNLKILISGYPQSHWVQPELPEYHFYEKIFLELEIAKFLKSYGAETFYKIHPDRNYGDLIKLYKQNYSKVITTRFEKLNLKKFDAIIHTYILGRPFMYSLMKDIPLILIDNDLKNWENQASKKLLKDRCKIVNYFHQISGPNFDKYRFEKILDEIKNGEVQYNFEYIKHNLN